MLQLPHRGVVTDVIGDIYPFLANGGLLQVQEVVDSTEVPTHVAARIVALVRHTREAAGVELGASSRAAIHLLVAAKAHATLQGRTTVRDSDLDNVAELVLAHRIIADDPRAIVAAALDASPRG
jgi:MoxR-like ATPase